MVDTRRGLWLTVGMTTNAKHTFKVEDTNSGWVLVWGTTEGNARRWFAKHYRHPSYRLVGPTGLILAVGA